MATLQQSSSEKLVVFIYGDCKSECLDLDLEPYSSFFNSVYEFTETGFSRWYKSGGISFFTKLRCGHIYLAILNPGSESLEIEHASLSHFETQDSNLRVSDDCNNNPTPTPTNINNNADLTEFIYDFQKTTDTDDNRINLQIEGTITYINLEGGFFGVITDSDEKYLPLNIQEELKKYNGKRIKITSAFTRQDVVTIFQWGKPLYVKEWEIVNEPPPMGCTKDLRICPDRSYVVRDPNRECNFPPCGFDMLEHTVNKTSWMNRNISKYKFDFNWSCYCVPNYTDVVTIYVENNAIVKIVNKQTKEEVENSSIATYYTLTELFEYIMQAYENHAYEIKCEYDESLSYIKSAFIDQIVNAIDDEMTFNVANFSESWEEEPPTNKKILMLHGGGGSPSSFQNQEGVADLRNALSDYDFIFADAPTNNLWIQDPPGGKDDPTQDPNWANDSISYLDNFISEHGPFDCILGYSQGAAFIPVYLSNTTNNFDKVVMCNGYLPYTHHGLMETINSNTPFNTASLVFSGENDFAFKDMADDLASKFSGSLNIRSSVAGHHLPINSDNTFNQILEFISSSI